MATGDAKTVTCRVCNGQKSSDEAVPGAMVRPAIADLIRKQYPDWSSEDCICMRDLNRFRAEYVQQSLEAARGELSALETEVVDSMKQEELLAKDINKEFDSRLTFGQRTADKVAEFGGSWSFIGVFTLIILAWIVMNTVALFRRPFDPYPYILLNLVLSCLAAIQAPVIMMSQNRQEAKDRLRAEHDYQVNLKSEIEVRGLGEKMDHLLHQQWQRLLEIQQIQTDLMQELIKKSSPPGGA